MTNHNQTVLITGATSGIGLELAKLFAYDNYNMVLIARDEERLIEIATELQEMGAGRITIITKDLCLQNAAAEIHHITSQHSIHIDVLVNNAGMAEYGLFSETDVQKDLCVIQLNIASMVQLTKLYMKDMIEHDKEGRILNLASVSSYQPSPMLAVYAATKAFVLSFSDAIAAELRDTDIKVTSLIPGPTDTDFFRKAGMEHTRAAQDNPEDPEIVALVGYQALIKGEPHAYPPGIWQVTAMSSLLSNQNVARMVEKQMQPY
jgi:short-subunit dehydrogenase